MPRGKKIDKKVIEPDAVFKSKVVSKMIVMIMKDGKKTLAEKLVNDSLTKIEPDDPKEARRYFEEAVKNVMPDMEVRSRRVGGANYQIPVPLKHDRSETLALRWMVDSARATKGMSMVDSLAQEIKQAYQNEGSAIKKKSDTHRMADANRAFAHFRW